MTMGLAGKQPYLKVCGGQPLKGEVEVSGAKNSVLPLLFASLLSEGEHEFQNVPCLKDVQLALNVLSSVGSSCKSSEGRLIVKTPGSLKAEPCPESARSFRASVLSLAPLLARAGQVKIPLPGGCDIGSRPIDFHLKGLRCLGAELDVEGGWIYGTTPKGGFKAADIQLDFPSVGATENLIISAMLAKGTSRLCNLACEPEIEDLICYLKSLGAQIEQRGLRELEITGIPRLKPSGEPYTVIPDRIEAGTWLIAGACTKGEVCVRKCRPDHLKALLEKLQAAGFILKTGETEVFLKAGARHKSVNVKTGVYPSFPTDLQSQFMALMTQLEGHSSIEETVFENRFRYIQQLNLLGANIQVKDQCKAFVKGPVSLKGNKMSADDLRAGAGLVLAGLTAKGESRIYGLHHIERGYDNFFSKLKALNATVILCDSE